MTKQEREYLQAVGEEYNAALSVAGPDAVSRTYFACTKHAFEVLVMYLKLTEKVCGVCYRTEFDGVEVKKFLNRIDISPFELPITFVGTV